MVANPRDLVHYRLTREEAELLPLLDGSTASREIVVDRLGTTGGLDVASVVDLVQLLEQGRFLDTPFVDVDAALERAVHPATLSAGWARSFGRCRWNGQEPSGWCGSCTGISCGICSPGRG